MPQRLKSDRWQLMLAVLVFSTICLLLPALVHAAAPYNLPDSTMQKLPASTPPVPNANPGWHPLGWLRNWYNEPRRYYPAKAGWVQRIRQSLNSFKCRVFNIANTNAYFWKDLTRSLFNLKVHLPTEMADYITNTYKPELLAAPHPRLLGGLDNGLNPVSMERFDASLPHFIHAKENVEQYTSLLLLHRYAHYTAASYCVDEWRAQQMYEPTTDANRKNFRMIAGYELKRNVEHGDSGGENPYYAIAVNRRQRVVVLSFRGVDNPVDFAKLGLSWLRRPDPALFSAAPAPAGHKEQPAPKMPDNARIFHGVQLIARKVVLKAVDELAAVARDYPDLSVVITGHSLGGPNAIIAATIARNRYRYSMNLTAVMTYGQMPFSTAAFADWSAQVIWPAVIVRTTTEADPVPSFWYTVRRNADSIRHGLLTVEVHFPDHRKHNHYICTSQLDQRCSAYTPCSKLTWKYHNVLAGLQLRYQYCDSRADP